MVVTNIIRTEKDVNPDEKATTAQELFAERFLESDRLETDSWQRPISGTGKFIIHITLQDHGSLSTVTVQDAGGQRKDISCNSLSDDEKGYLLQYIIERLAVGRPICRSKRCCAHHSRSRRSLERPDGIRVESEDSDQSEASSTAYPIDNRKRPQNGDGVCEFPDVKRRRRYRDSHWKLAKSSRRFQSQSPDTIPVRNTKTLVIGDISSVKAFYTQRFRDIQQYLCKLIAKAWVKIIHPNKQTNHPYAGRSQKAPPWWPPTPADGIVGTLKNGFVRHVEPDHLLRDERLILLPVILGHVTDPTNKKIPTMSSINVAKLEQVTNEAIGDRLNDQEPKRMFLNEMFRVARQQERFKNGEIDGTTEITIMDCDNRFSLKVPETSPNEASLELEGFGDGGQDLKPTILALNASPSVSSNETRRTRIRPYLPHGVSDLLGFNHSTESQNQVVNDPSYPRREASNYPVSTSIAQDPTRRHPLPSQGFSNSSHYFPSYSSGTSMIPETHYQQFHPTPQLPVASSFTPGPQLPPPTFHLHSQSPDFGQQQIFSSSSVYSRATDPVHAFSKELLLDNNSYSPQTSPLQQQTYQDYSQSSSSVETDVKRAHGKCVKPMASMSRSFSFDRNFSESKPQHSHIASSFGLQDGLTP